MDARLHTDVEEFASIAGPLFRADPVWHTVALTALAELREREVPGALFLTVSEGSQLRGAALRTPGYPLVVSGLPKDTAGAAVEVLARHGESCMTIRGPREYAENFASCWAQRNGRTVRESMAMRLYRLDTLRPPENIAGEYRTGGEDDLELLSRWRVEFARAAAPSTDPGEDARESTGASLRVGNAYGIWQVDGVPVAVAMGRAPESGMSRVSHVYTPPEHRGHGYASAVTAEVSRRMLGAGVRDVVLFTDLANPVSNAIYQRIGYRPVCDAVELSVG